MTFCDTKIRPFVCKCDFRFWHLADLPGRPLFGRYRVKSRRGVSRCARLVPVQKSSRPPRHHRPSPQTHQRARQGRSAASALQVDRSPQRVGLDVIAYCGGSSARQNEKRKSPDSLGRCRGAARPAVACRPRKNLTEGGPHEGPAIAHLVNNRSVVPLYGTKLLRSRKCARSVPLCLCASVRPRAGCK
jgi:hypothetical protein